MKTIPPAEPQKLLDEKSDLVVLDVRTPAEFGAAHIPQAQNIPLDALTPQGIARAITGHLDVETHSSYVIAELQTLRRAVVGIRF
jgi:rhodanese-related sulfurtransferase